MSHLSFVCDSSVLACAFILSWCDVEFVFYLRLILYMAVGKENKSGEIQRSHKAWGDEGAGMLHWVVGLS